MFAAAQRVTAVTPFRAASGAIPRARRGAVAVRAEASGSSYYKVVDGVKLDRKVVDKVADLKEANLFMRGLVPWLGFRACSIQYEPAARHRGTSKYNLAKLLGLEGHSPGVAQRWQRILDVLGKRAWVGTGG